MDDIEDGELPSSPEPYNPLPRPTALSNLRKSIESEENETNVDENSVPGLFPDSDPDSDSDSELPKKKRFQTNSMDVKDDGGGAVFQAMAAQFQAKKKNNIWGNMLQEETLTHEMTGIGVRRQMKDFGSDRGAESYNFMAASGNF